MDLIHFAYGLAVSIAIFYFLSTYQRRDAEGFNSAYRVALTIVLLYVLWMMVPYARAYADMVIHTRESRRTTTQLRKLSAVDLQAELVRARLIAPNAGLRCTRADRDWDYVCSYMPTPLQSTTRLQFGVNVDEKRWVNASRRVPEGTTLPSPLRQ